MKAPDHNKMWSIPGNNDVLRPYLHGSDESPTGKRFTTDCITNTINTHQYRTESTKNDQGDLSATEYFPSRGSDNHGAKHDIENLRYLNVSKRDCITNGNRKVIHCIVLVENDDKTEICVGALVIKSKASWNDLIAQLLNELEVFMFIESRSNRNVLADEVATD